MPASSTVTCLHFGAIAKIMLAADPGTQLDSLLQERGYGSLGMAVRTLRTIGTGMGPGTVRWHLAASALEQFENPNSPICRLSWA